MKGLVARWRKWRELSALRSDADTKALAFATAPRSLPIEVRCELAAMAVEARKRVKEREARP